jgi:hypothetical protein
VGAMMRVLAILFVAMTANAMTLGDYLASLERMRNEPLELAAIEAKALIGTTVEAPGGTFIADTSLLDSIANKRADSITRLDATIAALKSTSAARASTADAKLLERIREEERIRELKAGGEVLMPPEGNKSMLDGIAGHIVDAARWLRDKIVDFFEWLGKLWPKAPAADTPKPSGGVPFMVTALVIAIVVVLAIVALEVLRRSRRAKPDEIATSDPVASRRDEDPLSRGATEWERYAAQLAAAGRIREAIRAWYHAVLVTSYSAGILNFRKGRTNWEYISMMRAEVAWRPQFADLTRSYEREWYGRDESTYEALDDCSSRAQSILGQIRKRGAE